MQSFLVPASGSVAVPLRAVLHRFPRPALVKCRECSPAPARFNGRALPLRFWSLGLALRHASQLPDFSGQYLLLWRFGLWRSAKYRPRFYQCWQRFMHGFSALVSVRAGSLARMCARVCMRVRVKYSFHNFLADQRPKTRKAKMAYSHNTFQGNNPADQTQTAPYRKGASYE